LLLEAAAGPKNTEMFFTVYAMRIDGADQGQEIAKRKAIPENKSRPGKGRKEKSLLDR